MCAHACFGGTVRLQVAGGAAVVEKGGNLVAVFVLRLVRVDLEIYTLIY